MAGVQECMNSTRVWLLPDGMVREKGYEKCLAAVLRRPLVHAPQKGAVVIGEVVQWQTCERSRATLSWRRIEAPRAK